LKEKAKAESNEKYEKVYKKFSNSIKLEEGIFCSRKMKNGKKFAKSSHFSLSY
jgi:hypothetical protein